MMAMVILPPCLPRESVAVPVPFIGNGTAEPHPLEIINLEPPQWRIKFELARRTGGTQPPWGTTPPPRSVTVLVVSIDWQWVLPFCRHRTTGDSMAVPMTD